MADGVSDERMMVQMELPLNESDEAILHLLKKVSNLEYQNQELKEENKRLKWSLTEHD